MSAKVKKAASSSGKEHTRTARENDEESMTQKDAYMFPVYASIGLGSIYLAYKFLPKEYLNLVFSIHFTFIGFFCLGDLLQMPLNSVLPQKWRDIKVIDKKFHLKFTKYLDKEIHLDFNYFESVCLSIALGPSIYYFMTKNWVSNNLFGITFSVVGI